MTFDTGSLRDAARLIDLCRGKGLTLATAESCTGGLIASLVTAVAGSSDVFDCAFVTYSNDAKTRLLNVPPALIARVGAVSEEVATAMATGALDRSGATFAVAVTGIAGPGGGTAAKPVGLVHCSALRRGFAPIHEKLELGAIGREAIRLATVAHALSMAYALASAEP